MVKIDESYFDNNLEEELQEPAPVATDESVTGSHPRPLLGDLLDEEVSPEVVEADAPSDTAPAAMDPADDEETIDVTDEPASLTEAENTEELDAAEGLEDSEELEDEELSDESDQPEPSARKRSSHGLWYWLGGDMLEQPSFRKYIPAFIAILLMGLIHVTSNYQIIAKRRQIDKLETRVKDLTYKHMESVSELTRRSIGGNFEQQLQAMGSDLEASSQQSIILYRDAKK
ncbi:FtsL-like putative cell division protein [Porphyromonas uenonis]|uniref:FtsL-like putative cell division protein n=1 Tax=Porphyromonas uenonis TaxID=281920 RepID=UPI0026F2E1EF|nr:FtsL-like putative cell division protein [Porphyromonas uenonis]